MTRNAVLDSDEEEEEYEYEYKSLVNPEELQGITSIWNFVLTAGNNEVVENAIEFLINMYCNVSTQLKTKTADLI